MAVALRALGPRHLALGPEEIRGLVERVGCRPRIVSVRNGAAAGDDAAVHEDETPERGIFAMRIEGDRRRRSNRHVRNIVARDRHVVLARRARRECRGVDHAMDFFDPAFDGLRRELERVAAPAPQRLAAEPDDARLEARELAGKGALGGRDVAAFDEDLLFDRDANRFAGGGAGYGRTGPPLDRLDGRALA